MRKLILALMISCATFGQNKIDRKLYQEMANEAPEVKGKVSFLKESNFDYKNDVMRKEFISEDSYYFDKNGHVIKYIGKVENYTKSPTSKDYIREEWDETQTCTYEEFPTYLKKRVIVSKNRGKRHDDYESQYIFIKKGNSMFKKGFNGKYELEASDINGDNRINTEFVLDSKNQIIERYEYDYNNGGKSGKGSLYEYNDKGQVIKATSIKNGNPSTRFEYTLNQHGDVIEEVCIDLYNNNTKMTAQRLYTYTYDKNGNWITKKVIFHWYDSLGKKSGGLFEMYKREITYYK